MISIKRLSTILGCQLFFILSVAASASPDAPALYTKYCAECHNANRLGAVGPALLPQNLKRLRKKSAISVIENSRPASQMPPFKDILSKDQIHSLVELIYTPLESIPPWGMEQVLASQLVYHRPGELPDKPLFDADSQLDLHCTEGLNGLIKDAISTLHHAMAGSVNSTYTT